MATTVIISSSVRNGRKSHPVALFFKQYIEAQQLASVIMLDLNEYKFPIFEERLKLQTHPAKEVPQFAEAIKQAADLIPVTPEYNGGYPGSLKNVTDLLYNEWHRKPVAISTVSNGVFGGTQVISSLQFTLRKLKAWTVPAMFPVPSADKTFDESGQAIEKAATEKRAAAFIAKLMWCIEANKRMN
ncbi:MAG: NADPH-dependent FMN reductase [Ferruginibacter sp.]